MSSVHQSLYEKAIDQLEEIVEADPNFEYQDEEDFVEEMADSSHASLTTAQVARIQRLHRKYVVSDSANSSEVDEED